MPRRAGRQSVATLAREWRRDIAKRKSRRAGRKKVREKSICYTRGQSVYEFAINPRLPVGCGETLCFGSPLPPRKLSEYLIYYGRGAGVREAH
ncbi:MAG: hypothetical protein KDD67_09825 [Ignavibacteriae bacterium]|nr:hypothetical protein [Ignavibacteriota bacterium]